MTFIGRKVISKIMKSLLLLPLLILPIKLFAQSDFFTFTQLIEDGVGGADGLRSVNATAVSPDGKHLYVVSTGDFSIALYKRNITSGNISFIEIWRDRSSGVEGLDDPAHVLISPDGAHVYVGAYDGKTVSVFDRNKSSGLLSFKQVVDLGASGYGPVSFLAISPDGKDLFAVSEYVHNYKKGLSQLKRDVVTGELSWLFWYEGKWGVDTFETNSAVEAVSVSANGKYVFVTAQASRGASLSVLSRKSPNQRLGIIEHEVHRDDASDGLSRPNTVISSPDNAFVYVVDEGFPRGIATYAQNSTTGEIDFVDFRGDYYAGRASMTKSGSHVFLIDNTAIVAFERNRTNGHLNYIDRIDYDDTENGNLMNYRLVLLNPDWMSISPDGAFLYVSNSTRHMLGVFQTKAGAAGVQKFQINPGLNGSWFYPATDGQGFLIDVLPENGQVFLAWFTYDTDFPPRDATANLGNAGQRWMTALGNYSDSQAVLDIYQAEGGLFDMTAPKPDQAKDGTIILEFKDCNSGTVTYDIPSIRREGVIPIQRIALDNVGLCETLGNN